MPGMWRGTIVALLFAAACTTSGSPPANPAGGASAAAPGAASAPLSLTAAYGSPSGQTGPTWLAFEEGYFQKHGLTVNLIRAEDVAGLGSLSGGETQIVQLGGEVTTNATLGGGDYLFVGSLVNRFVFKIFGEKGMTDVQQLRGKTVAVNRPGTSSDVAFRKAILKVGLTPDVDVTFLSVGDTSAQFAALHQGIAVAAALSPPTNLTAEREGYPMLLDIAQLNIPAVQSGYVTTRAALQSHREAIKRYMAAVLEATQLCIAGDDGCVRAVAKYSQRDEETARAAVEVFRPNWEPTLRVSREAIASVLETSQHPLARTAQPEQFFDNSIMDELVRASGR